MGAHNLREMENESVNFSKVWSRGSAKTGTCHISRDFLLLFVSISIFVFIVLKTFLLLFGCLKCCVFLFCLLERSLSLLLGSLIEPLWFKEIFLKQLRLLPKVRSLYSIWAIEQVVSWQMFLGCLIVRILQRNRLTVDKVLLKCSEAVNPNWIPVNIFVQRLATDAGVSFSSFFFFN